MIVSIGKTDTHLDVPGSIRVGRGLGARGNSGTRLNRLVQAGVRQVRLFPLLALAGALVTGILLWGAFNWSLELTNTESFCISCHAMRDNVYAEYQKTRHYENRTGVRATCPDCHVPKEWMHKVQRKIVATNELFHWMIGSIDTPEKFEAKRAEMAEDVWASMKQTDSRECRNCHEIGHMAKAVQKPVAARMHEIAAQWKSTCIDCHKGVTHSTPAGYSPKTLMDDLHARFKREKVPCHDCHKGMARAKNEDDWK